ncbi:hypothetical protein, partial [Salmonella enterica]|uniref:hypothetical protein n=1 Tax=Salmonella enterica TaxID=28901 RepID=UPI003CE88388
MTVTSKANVILPPLFPAGLAIPLPCQGLVAQLKLLPYKNGRSVKTVVLHQLINRSTVIPGYAVKSVPLP